jgi:hypothetical protein
MAPHVTLPDGHWHLPFTQMFPPVHALPHPPQLLVSVSVWTQLPAQNVRVGSTHVSAHTPEAQSAPVGHLCPQAPQLYGSFWVSWHGTPDAWLESPLPPLVFDEQAVAGTSAAAPGITSARRSDRTRLFEMFAMMTSPSASRVPHRSVRSGWTSSALDFPRDP